LFLTAVPVLAHHAFAAEFDHTKPLQLKGTVTKMEWLNPHTWLHLDVKQPDGMVINWAVEGGAPNALIRRGMTKDSIKPGEEITVEGFAAKDGSNMATGAKVYLADGRALFVGSQGLGAPPSPERPRD
jgi:hypothetical protein